MIRRNARPVRCARRPLRRGVAVALVSATLLAGCGGDGDDGAAGGEAQGDGGDLCAGVDAAELSDVWGDVEANAIGGMCSILVANGTALRLTRAEGEAGYEALVDELVGADEPEDVEIGDRAVFITGTSAGDAYVVLVGDVAFRLAAVGVPVGQLQATAESIAGNL